MPTIHAPSKGSSTPTGPFFATTPFIFPATDSRGAQNWVTSTDVPAPLARSYLWRIEMRTQRVRLTHKYSLAKSGDSIAQLLDRLTNDTVNDYGVKPSQVPPGVCWMLIGTNSVNAYTGAAGQGTIAEYTTTLLGQLTKCLDWAVGRGHMVLLCAEWPRGDATSTTALLSVDAQKVMQGYAEGIRNMRRRNVQVIDVWPRTADPAKTDCTPLPNMLNGDFLHNSNGIAEVCAQECDQAVNYLMGLPRMNLCPSNNGDQYLAGVRPTGCLNTNPMLVQGAGGTLSGANVSGAVPEGYTLTAASGLTVVGSFTTVTLPDGTVRNAYLMDVSGTPTSNNATAILRQSGMIGKLVAGDTIEALQEVYVGPGAVNFSSPGLMLDSGATATRLHGGLSITGDLQMPAQVVKPYYGVARTNQGTFATLPASLSFQFGAYFTLLNVATSLKLYILSAAARKVTT